MTKCEQNESKTAYTIKDKSLKLLSFMERETRLELATSSLARRHSTTELPPLMSTILHAQILLSSDFPYSPLIRFLISFSTLKLHYVINYQKIFS